VAGLGGLASPVYLGLLESQLTTPVSRMNSLPTRTGDDHEHQEISMLAGEL
jgi:hypothetical protein